MASIHVAPAPCVGARASTRRLLAGALLLAAALGDAPCRDGSIKGGFSQRWPRLNPGLVAPVAVNYSYPNLGNPIMSEFTGNVIAIPMPANYEGGFQLGTESYRLRRMELRKAGMAPAGVGQALIHSLEAVLLHAQVDGPAWASITVGIQVSGASSYDALFPLVTGATMPTRAGEEQPLILSAAYPVQINALLSGATLAEFWTVLPTTCNVNVYSRQLMVMAAQNIGYETYRQILGTLENAPTIPVVPAASSVWTLNSCGPTGACTDNKAVDLPGMITDAQSRLSMAVAELRERKGLMDDAYDTLVGQENGTTGSETDSAGAALTEAISARQDLIAAQQEFESIDAYTTTLLEYANETPTWDANNPYLNVTASAPNASSPAAAASAPSFLARPRGIVLLARAAAAPPQRRPLKRRRPAAS